MNSISIQISTPVAASSRLAELERQFGYVAPSESRRAIECQFPESDEWTIGAIVGPSGSGKSLAAKAAFPDAYFLGPQADRPWPAGTALVDCLGERPLAEIAETLCAVGLGSVPAWVRPYAALSDGERFRAELARALIESEVQSLAVIVADEFTSSLDREVAKGACHALARHLRRRTRCHKSSVTRSVTSTFSAPRMVAVTCHDDILPWLAPDWVIEMPSGKLAWRRLRRPPLALDVCGCHRNQWRAFRRHHYLGGDEANRDELHVQSECFVATLRPNENADRPRAVAFLSLLNAVGMKGVRRISRLVVLPAFQALGIGRRLAEWAGEFCSKRGHRLRISTAHPAMLAALSGSDRWLLRRRVKSREHAGFARWTRPRLLGRTLTTFEYAARATPAL